MGFGTILWALIPLLSLGLLAPVPFAMAAVRLRQRWMWVVTAGYAIGSALVIVGTFGPEGGWGETLVGTVILVLMVAGTAHAFLLRGRVFTPSPTTRTARRPRWLMLLASIGMLLLGGGVVAAGVDELVFNLRPSSAASRRADGVVIRIESVTTGSGSERRTTDHPVVRFLTAREQVIVFTSSSGGSHSVGDSVKVRYDPNNPHRARLDSLGDRVWRVVMAVGLLLGGLVVMFWGGVLFVSASAGTPLAWRTVRYSSGRPWRGG